VPTKSAQANPGGDLPLVRPQEVIGATEISWARTHRPII